VPETTKKKRHIGKRFAIGFGLLVLLFMLVSLGITKIVYDKQFPRYDRADEALSANLRYHDIEADYPRLLVSFNSTENTLQGYLYGSEHSRALMVIAHGLGGGADSYLSQIKHFVDAGFRVFAYDCTGSYDSEGKSTKGFPQAVLDLHAALSYIESQPTLSSLPLLLFGHSWGGYAVVNVLNFGHDVTAVVSVSGANSAMDMVLEQGHNLMGSFIYTQYPFLWLYQHLLFGSVASSTAVSALNKTDIPVLIIHGIEDEMVHYSGSSILAKRDRITNEKVSYITATQEGRNAHNNLFRTDEMVQYVEKVNAQYRLLFDAYDGEIPYETNKEFYDGIDRLQLSMLQPSLMQEIDAFLDRALTEQNAMNP